MISLPPRRRVFRPGDCLERLDQRLQYVSEFLEELPDDVIVQTAAKYREAMERLIA